MQRTVVTEKCGALRGKRVVRGREAECRQHHGVAPDRAVAPISQRPASPARTLLVEAAASGLLSTSTMPTNASSASRRSLSSWSR